MAAHSNDNLDKCALLLADEGEKTLLVRLTSTEHLQPMFKTKT